MPDARHVSDRDLLASIDGELSARRLAAVEGHLAICETCSARRRAFDQTHGKIAGLLQEGKSDSAFAARARLQASLAETSRQMDRSWFVRMRPAFPALRLALACGAAVAAALMLARQPDPPTDIDFASNAVETRALPLSQFTPGTVTAARADSLCLERNAPEVPVVPAAMARQVLRAYGMENEPIDSFELDYLVTPELGGALEASNLWPQPYGKQRWNAFVKDELERLLPDLVCTGRVSLEAAQRDIATDWIAAYRKYFKTRDPLSSAFFPSRKLS